MIKDLIPFGARQLRTMAMNGTADPYDVIDELARRISNRRRRRRFDNGLAIKIYAELAVKFNYRPLPRRR